MPSDPRGCGRPSAGAVWPRMGHGPMLITRLPATKPASTLRPSPSSPADSTCASRQIVSDGGAPGGGAPGGGRPSVEESRPPGLLWRRGDVHKGGELAGKARVHGPDLVNGSAFYRTQPPRWSRSSCRPRRTATSVVSLLSVVPS